MGRSKEDGVVLMNQIAFLFSFIRNDRKARFAGSVLGSVWTLAVPAGTVAVYWFVYTVALQGPKVDGTPYLPWLVGGILPWFFFADGLQITAFCFWEYRSLVCKTQFRAEILPLARVFSAFLSHLVLMGLSYVGFCLMGVSPCAGQIWVLGWMVGGFFLVLGISRILALWTACLRDVADSLPAVLSLGFWLTPVFWNPAGLPPVLHRFCQWNPAAILVDGYRQALLYGRLPALSSILIFLGEGILFYGISIILMKKIRPTLADRL